MVEFEKQNAQSPDVRFKALHLTPQAFRSHIGVGSSHSGEPLLVFDVATPPEVAEFHDFLSSVHDDVFGLEIPHNDPLRMQIFEGLQNLRENVLDFVFHQRMLVSDEEKEIAPSHVLQEDVELVPLLEVSIELDDVVMSELGMNVDFPV